jgi:hypothetical protein
MISLEYLNIIKLEGYSQHKAKVEIIKEGIIGLEVIHLEIRI